MLFRSNAYRTNAHQYAINRQTFLEIQKRDNSNNSSGGGLKDFFETFKEKLDENIKQTPEFGGDLKRLSDTSSSTAETLKKTTGKVSESVETIKNVSQQIIEPIAANPQVQEAGSKTGRFICSVFAYMFDLFTDTLILPVRDRFVRTAFKQDLDAVLRYRFASTRSRFDPSMPDESLLDGLWDRKVPAEITEYKDKQIDNVKGKVNQKWNDLGEGDTRLSVLIEKADSYGSSLKKMSNSKITATVEEIRTIFPTFRYENFRKWLTKILFQRLVRGDSGLFPMMSDRIRKKFMDRNLPKYWTRIKVLHLDVYEHPESNYAFIFTFRGRAMEWYSNEKPPEKPGKSGQPGQPILDPSAAPAVLTKPQPEPKRNKVRPVSFSISVAIKLHELGFWQLTDYHEIEVAAAPF